MKKYNFHAEDIAYYKPIQCGVNPRTDFETISMQQPKVSTYNTYLLNYPASPDYAAKLDGFDLSLDLIKLDFEKIKAKHKFVIVEGAGGLAVPINGDILVSDIAKTLDLPVVLVSKNQLGNINQSLLSLEHLAKKGLDCAGIIFSDKEEVFLDQEYGITDREMLEAQKAASIESILNVSGQKVFSLGSFLEKQYSVNAKN